MLASLLVGLVFLFFEGGSMPGKIGFPYSSMVLSAGTYVYFLMETVVLIILAAALLVGETEFKTTCWVFLFIQVVDLVDYVLTYNQPFLFNSDVTLNVAKVFIFAVSIAYDRHVGTNK